MASDKMGVRYQLLEFDKGSTTPVASRNIRKVYMDDAIAIAHIVDGLRNSGKESEAVKFRQSVDDLH